MARSLQPLISTGVSEEEGSFEFITNFDRIYTPPGAQRPPFYCGTMASAIQTAWARPAPEIKLFVVYLHREGNPLTRKFSRIFLSGVVNQLLLNNCVLWGWDMTSEANRQSLVKIVTNNLGYDNAWRLQTLAKAFYPCFVFLSRTDKKAGVALVQLLRASTDLSFSVSLFANAVRMFTTKIRPVLIMKEEKGNVVRQPDPLKVKTSQNSLEGLPQLPQSSRPKSPEDRKQQPKIRPPKRKPEDELMDGQESLQSIADKMVGNVTDLAGLFEPSGQSSSAVATSYPYHAQDEAARQRMAELRKQYLEAEYERLKAEKNAIFTRILQDELHPPTQPGPSSEPKPQPKQDKESKDWEIRKKLKPSEKPSEYKRPTSRPANRNKNPDDRGEFITIRFRSYKEVFEKRFKADDNFEKLLLFLSSRGYSFTEFKILAGWPRVDISQEDSRTPLRHLNFHFKDNVILAKRKTPFHP